MVKEVPEVAPMSSELEAEECASVVMDKTLNLTKPGVPLDDNDMQVIVLPKEYVRCSLVLYSQFM
jgi:hypothetical protein